jgi:hypothetical protein
VFRHVGVLGDSVNFLSSYFSMYRWQHAVHFRYGLRDELFPYICCIANDAVVIIAV